MTHDVHISIDIFVVRIIDSTFNETNVGMVCVCVCELCGCVHWNRAAPFGRSWISNLLHSNNKAGCRLNICNNTIGFRICVVCLLSQRQPPIVGSNYKTNTLSAQHRRTRHDHIRNFIWFNHAHSLSPGNHCPRSYSPNSHKSRSNTKCEKMYTLEKLLG